MQNIVWIADEYKKHERDRGWYAGLFIMAVLLIGWALYTHNVIAIILFVLITLVLYALTLTKPRKIHVALTDKGLFIDQTFRPYGMMRSFWIIYEPPHLATLNFEEKRKTNNRLTVELEDQDVEVVREYLNQYLPENEEYEEHLLDFLVRKLRL